MIRNLIDQGDQDKEEDQSQQQRQQDEDMKPAENKDDELDELRMFQEWSDKYRDKITFVNYKDF